MPGSDLSRLTLEPKAAERVGIRTAEVGVRSIPVGLRLPTREVATIPYAALLYGADGNAFVYTNPEPFVFVRHPVVVETIDGDTAVLAVGPPLGMPVVMEGASELAGIEFGVGK